MPAQQKLASANQPLRSMGTKGIENKNHYARNVSMCEDASRIHINAAIFARARSFALNILRAKGETNIADALWNMPSASTGCLNIISCFGCFIA